MQHAVRIIFHEFIWLRGSLTLAHSWKTISSVW